MPIDPSIPLQGRPPVSAPVDFNSTFRTLAQLKYLDATTQAAQEEAARKQQLFQEQGAAGQYLSSLGHGAVPPQALMPPQPHPGAPSGGPPFDEAPLAALPQGGSTPPPGAGPAGPAQPPAPAARRPTIFDPEVQAELHRIAPHAAGTLIDTHQKVAIARLEGEQKLYEHVARGLHLVTDQPTYDAWRLAVSTTLPPDVAGRLPTTWTPDLVPKLLAGAQSLSTTFDQHIATGKLANETTNAQTQRLLAETGQQAEARQATELTYQPSVEGTVPAPRYGVHGAPPGTPVPGTARPLTPAEAQAQWHVEQATSAHTTATQLEQTGKSGTGIVQKTLSGVPGIGNYLTPADAQKYNQAKLAFMTAVNRGRPPSPAEAAVYEKEYFPQPGETNPTVIKQKQEARATALRGLQIETNRPVGVTPPGLRPKQGTAPGTSPAAGATVLTPADMDATVKASGRSRAEVVAAAKRRGYQVQGE
jgi:hypothetical protein